MDTTVCRFLQSKVACCRAGGQPALRFSCRITKPTRSPSSCWERTRLMSTSPTASVAETNPYNPHFVVVSLGNPPPHGESLHSAGHVALQALQREIRVSHNQPYFDSERIGKKATQVSRSPKYTLLQSPMVMNVSGPWVAKAWATLLSKFSLQDPNRPLGLVVVHDDLEEDMSIVKIRKWERSHRGHNGLKSTQTSLQARTYPDCKFAKISVGIGRPEGRDHDTVANYVLKPWSKYQKQTLFEQTGESVLAALREIEATWEEERDKGTIGLPKDVVPPVRKAKR